MLLTLREIKKITEPKIFLDSLNKSYARKGLKVGFHADDTYSTLLGDIKTFQSSLNYAIWKLDTKDEWKFIGIV